MVAAGAEEKYERDRLSGRVRSPGVALSEIDVATLAHMIGRFANVGQSDRVLDVPCADGALAFEIAHECCYVVGVDISESMVAEAAARNVTQGLDNTSFQIGGAERLEFGDGTFDRVICWNGLHHFAEPEIALSEMTRVLRSPGYVTLVEIDASEDRAWRETHDRIERSRDPRHHRLFTRIEVRALLEDLRLSIEKETRWRLRRSFEEWMAPLDPDEGTRERTHRMLTEAAQRKSAGLEISVKGRTIDVTHRMAGWVALKLS